MSSSADYYKPIKGIPIVIKLASPYYLPDDFVMLGSNNSGLVAFRMVIL